MENQYLQLLKDIIEKGTLKPSAREGMPSTKSLFGYQMRHNLQDGFPLLTTKQINFDHIVAELLWFLKGDNNIKYLVDNDCNIWNEDAYNYYLKIHKQYIGKGDFVVLIYKHFVSYIKSGYEATEFIHKNLRNSYKLGDCGFQYGKVWRKWQGDANCVNFEHDIEYRYEDQIKNLITGLIENPESRRHILTSVDPAHDKDLALYWCHALTQFNCRPLSWKERCDILNKSDFPEYAKEGELCDEAGIPRYYLDCQMYQRSADVFLGVPYNIASYSLLTHILCEICNMIPGDFIHTFGDVHIYENHEDAVKEQLSRVAYDLPKLKIKTIISPENLTKKLDTEELNKFINYISSNKKDFIKIENYNFHPAIKAKLSTGLK